MNIVDTIKALRKAGAIYAAGNVGHSSGIALGESFECWIHVFKAGVCSTEGKRFTAPTLSACSKAAMDWLGVNPDVAAAAIEATNGMEVVP